MEFKINMEELRKQKLFVATPMYGGNCHGMYAKGTNDLSILFTKYGIEVRFYYLLNESLIQRARNYCVDEFLRSDCTHMLFIDSDIGFNARDVVVMLHLQVQNKDRFHILTAPYPKKTIAWEKVKRAVEVGFADTNPKSLDAVVGDYVFNPAKGVKSFRIDEPVEVMEAGTGFMLIPRETLVKYAEAYPQFKYKPDHVRTEHFAGDREITAFFDCIIDPETKRYLSEDYFFCQMARKAGLQTWMCPWIELKHVGSYIFGGSLAAISQISASPTASPEARFQKKDSTPEPPAGNNRQLRRANKSNKKG